MRYILADVGQSVAVTERGTKLDKFTEDDIELSLRLLALAGGDVGQTVGTLADEGIIVQHNQLRYWRDVAFPLKYGEIRALHANDIGEDIAGRALERALQADEAERVYLEAAVEKLDEVPAERLAPNALALAKAKGENVEKAQLLRNRPTEIREVRDTAEILDVLAREGVLVRDPRLSAIDGEGVELDVEKPDA